MSSLEHKPKPEAAKHDDAKPKEDAQEARSSGRERPSYFDQVAYRFSGGKVGTSPLAGYYAERAATVGASVEREGRRAMLKSDGGKGEGKAQIPTGSGASLPGDTRAKIESAMGGVDLSGMRVHTGGDSAAAAKNFGARAFAHGQDVHFAAGEYTPGTKEGDRLLAHEAAHTVQAQRTGIQRKAEDGHAGGEHGVDVSQPDEPAEQEADAVGDHVADKLHGDKGGEAGHEHGKAPKEQAAPKINAKLDGVGRKIFLAKPDRDPTTPRKDARQVPATVATQGGIDIQILPGKLDHVLRGHTVENFDPVARVKEIGTDDQTSLFKPGFATNEQEIVTLVKQALQNKQSKDFDPASMRTVTITIRNTLLRVAIGPVRAKPGSYMLNSIFPVGGVSLNYAEVRDYADQVTSGKKTLKQVRSELLARFK